MLSPGQPHRGAPSRQLLVPTQQPQAPQQRPHAPQQHSQVPQWRQRFRPQRQQYIPESEKQRSTLFILSVTPNAASPSLDVSRPIKAQTLEYTEEELPQQPKFPSLRPSVLSAPQHLQGPAWQQHPVIAMNTSGMIKPQRKPSEPSDARQQPRCTSDLPATAFSSLVIKMKTSAGICIESPDTLSPIKPEVARSLKSITQDLDPD